MYSPSEFPTATEWKGDTNPCCVQPRQPSPMIELPRCCSRWSVHFRGRDGEPRRAHVSSSVSHRTSGRGHGHLTLAAGPAPRPWSWPTFPPRNRTPSRAHDRSVERLDPQSENEVPGRDRTFEIRRTVNHSRASAPPRGHRMPPRHSLPTSRAQMAHPNCDAAWPFPGNGSTTAGNRATDVRGSNIERKLRPNSFPVER